MKQDYSKIEYVIVPRTGVLTDGAPNVVEVLPAPHTQFTEDLILSLAASANYEIDHPIAKALTAKAESRGLSLIQPTWSSTQSGRGVVASVSGVRVLVGNSRLLQESLLPIDPLSRLAEKYMNEGQTVLYVAADSVVAGIIVLEEDVHPKASDAIARLHAAGVTVAGFTGDHLRSADALAEKLGLERIHAELSSNDELARLQQLRSSGRPVMFFGRGHADHHMLARADIGAVLSKPDDSDEDSEYIRIRDIEALAELLLSGRNPTLRHKLASSHTFFALISGIAVGLVTGVIFSLLLPDPAAIVIGILNGIGAFLLSH